MLTSCKLTGSAAKIAAYHSSEENYYFSQAGGVDSIAGDPGAGGPRIHGDLVAALGFTDGAAITERDLTNLLSSRDAAGNLIAREHKVIGIDLTFSAPKSVSVAGLLTDRDPSIIAAHDRAVLETMREVERYTAGTQLFRDGEVSSVKTGNMAYVTVRDGFNREHEPHLHTHVVVMNLTAYGDKIMALDGRQIMRHDFNKVWGAMYRAKLAANLKEAGHSVSYTKKGELRLDSVSLDVEQEFSTRRAEIVAAKKRGVRDMEAWRKTRKEKAPDVEKGGVFADWQARLEQYQTKTVAQNRADSQAAREAWTRDANFSIEAIQELAGERGDTEAGCWQAAARRATERTATVTANALITEYLTELARSEAWAPITYSVAEQRLIGEVRAGRLLVTDDGRYTTWEMTRADRECVRDREAPAALALRPDDAKSLVAEYVRKSRGLGLRGLSDQQAAAAAGILSADRGTVVVQGDAGAGKTTMLKAVQDIAGQKGWETVGLAIQGIAARNLQEESGISSSTVSSYLARERTADREQLLEPRASRLIVIDEASMNDSRGLAELMRLADKHGDKIVLVGDRNQIQSVGAGRPFDRLVETAEASGQLLSLCENYRQRDPNLREAVNIARDGKMRESLDILARTGRITEIQDKTLRRMVVASLYDKDTLIVTGSKESRDDLNFLIRDGLAKRAIIDLATARTYELTWRDADGMRHAVQRELAVGDVITFLKNDYRKDFDVRNGERGEVIRTSARGLSVRLEDGRVVDVDIQRYAALDYGYAMTTYKSQGQTYNKVVVDADTSISQLQDQRNTYVQITRARDDVRVFTDDQAELREVASVLNFKKDTFWVDATLEKATAMERRVHAEAFGDRARREAEAKILLAEAAAETLAGRLERMVEESDEQKISETASSSSSETSQPASRNADPALPETASQIPASRPASASLPLEAASYSPSVTANIMNFKSLFGEQPLEGTAEILREELVRAAATGMAQDEAIADRLAMLDKTTAAFTEGADEIMQAPQKVRRVMLERLDREVERRLMLTGELPDEDVRRVHEEIRTSLPENVITPLAVSNEDFLGGAGKSETIMRGYERHLAAVTECLRNIEMLNDAEKQTVAQELSKPESTHALLETIGHPEVAVAFAVVRSRAADLSGATNEFPATDVRQVEGLLITARKVEETTAKLSVCHSEAGYYLGMMEDGELGGRYSMEYWQEEAAAETALRTGRFSYRDGTDKGHGLDR
jgi:conjugative relaxase-like TrwC/TraI family protein